MVGHEDTKDTKNNSTLRLAIEVSLGNPGNCMAYKIAFADSVKAHLQVLTGMQRATVLDAIERRLTNEPLSETRNRKPLRPNPIAPWELRVGTLRVFYDVSEGQPPTVRVLAVGVKDGNVLRIGGQEIQL